MVAGTTSGGSGGFALALLTESFAVRALVGSLAAALLAGTAVRLQLVRGTGARRLVILAPVLTAAVAAVATTLENAAYLPQLWVMPTGTAAGGLVDLIDELWHGQHLNLALVGYGAGVSVLLLRRVLGMLSVRRLLRHGRPADDADTRVVGALDDLAPRMGLSPPRLLMLPACPGGAFAHGTYRPVVAVDPWLARSLDDRELEGLVAHELAHIRRRDNLLCLVVGVFHDLTFFLPAMSLAARWLRHEQEESADEVAARHTGRPAALASSILKVWDRVAAGGAAPVCAAVPPRPAVATGPGWVSGRRASALSEGASLVTRRVERLIATPVDRTAWRGVAETSLAAGVLGLATMTALTIPGWIAERTSSELWAVGSLSGSPTAATVESPAFQTFHALTDETPRRSPAALPAAGAETAGCPCVETQSQLREGAGAVAQQPRGGLRWGQTSVDLDTPTVERLATFEQGPRFGFFFVETPRPATGP